MTRNCANWVLRLSLLAMIVMPGFALGAEMSIQSDTLIRVFERDTADEEDAAVVPGYQYLQGDIGELNDYGLSFHFNAWGRADFADNDYYSDQTAGEILYGYLEYSQEVSRFTAQLGRLYVFEGVANEAVDGLRLSSDLGEYFSLSAYGGQPAALDAEEGRSGDSIFGGRVAHHLGSQYEVGLSYKTIDNDDETAEELLGVDLSLFLPKNLSFFGYSSYNQETEGWGEHSYELRIPVGSVLITPYYQQFNYEDYFERGVKTVNPFRFLADGDEELTAFGVDALWQLDDRWTLGAKAKFFDYDEQDNAETYSVLAIWQGEGLTQFGGEISHTANDDSAGNEYTLFRLYGYCDSFAESYWVDFVSADLVIASYDEDIYGEDSSFFISFGTGKLFLNDALEVKVSGDYSEDPYFDEDFRGMLKVTYNYDQE